MPDLPPGFRVRRLRPDEAELLRRWPDAEGWNPGLHDAATFLATDPQGFFLGELDGEPVASVSCVAYDDEFGFLGLYIVQPQHRGKGFGLAVWNAGMAHLGGRNVGLDGVVAQQDNYRRSGFQLAYRNVRYQLTGAAGPTPAGVVDLNRVPFADVAALDRTAFPAAREGFLKSWFALPGSAALGVLREGKLAGFGAIRPAAVGIRVGPLTAVDTDAATAVLGGLLAHAAGKPVFLDAPDANKQAAELVARVGGTVEFPTARMYTKGPPAVAVERIFGVTSLELG